MEATKKRKSHPVEEIDLTLTCTDDDDNDYEEEVECVGVTQAPTASKRNRKPVAATIAAATVASTSYRYRESTTDMISDYELARALAAQEKCSQFTPAENQRRGLKRTFACGICLEDRVPGFQGYTLSCKHRFCKPCLTGLIQASLGGGPASAGTARMLECPAPLCKNHLTLNDVQYILQHNQAAFQKYAATANMSLLELEARDESSDTRRCPAKRCNYIFVFTKGTGAEGCPFVCADCNASFCLECGANDGKVGPEHPGLSCAERREQLEQQAEERRKFQQWQEENSQADKRFNELITKEQKQGKTMPCPKCRAMITKNGGCSHMYCTACKTNFNWQGR